MVILIAVKQIVRFLEAHAHPTVARTDGKPALPQNVTDQMLLWAGEDKRVTFGEGELLTFGDDGAFDAAAIGASWSDRRTRRVFRTA